MVENGAETPLRKSQAIRTLRAVEEELGATDRGRLTELLPLISEDGRIILGAALSKVFPEHDSEDALTRFRQLRARLRQAAEAADLDLELAVDTNKRSPPDERLCWFAGQSLAASEVERFSREAAQGAQPVNPVLPQALRQLETRDGKPVLRYFVSYAHRDEKLKNDLLDRLKLRFACSPEFVFEGWEDGDILPGEQWQHEIRRAMERCHFGLLLVSHAFLASRFITNEELPKFLPPEGEATVAWRRAVPVGLREVPFDGSIDLKGLRPLQFFLDDRRFYEQRTVARTKNVFVNELFQRIVSLGRKHVVGTGGSTSPVEQTDDEILKASDRPAFHRTTILAREQRLFLERDEAGHIVPTEGVRTHLSKDLERATGGERVDALDFLEEWVQRPESPPFCALLGDYGMGKTTTCKALTLRLLAARETDPSLPLPIYLDLRHLGETAKAAPSLTQILDRVLRKSWYGGREVTGLEAEEIVRLVQEEGAVALFDGLDEVLVHLSPAGGQLFTRELWRILPPSVFRRQRANHEITRSGRLLISCRTHYFRTLREQSTHFTGEDREGIAPSDYQALLLLPFTEAQIREYLRRNLPEQDLDVLLELIRSVHNLTELAQRPYTLSLIARQIPQLEQLRMEGRAARGVTLYRNMVQSWLDRDTGKHQITPDHKQRLMEHLAAALWKSGARTWNIDALEQWLIDFLEDNPRLAAHYSGKDRELLKEDLRTATFLVREGEGDFRFAHTSLQEFFLAAWLHRALLDDRLADWVMKLPTPPTLHFLGELLDEQGTSEGLAALRTLRDAYRPQASELAFAYSLHAISRGLPAPSLTGVCLAGADLRGWCIEGPEGGPLLDLRNADLREVRLVEASLRRVDLGGASLRAACLDRAEILDGRARDADFGDSSLVGTWFRQVDMTGSRFEAADLYHTKLLHCHVQDVSGLEAQDPGLTIALCEPADEFPSASPGALNEQLPKAVATTGLVTGLIFSSAFSPDGARLVTTGEYGTVQVWDARSGDPRLTLQGHRTAVWCSTFSPDGKHVISAGEDGTVRVWDANSGDPLLTLQASDDWVRAAGFSPDGSELVSAGDDGIVRIWDARSGAPLLNFVGHSGGVWASAFSPDGTQLVSAGVDGAVRVWNARSGDPLLALHGHAGPARASAFSPDGRRLVSAGEDGIIRVWDAGSGDPLLTIKAHRGGVTASAFSSDGTRLVSAGGDGMVRVWNAQSGDPLLTFEAHDMAWSSAFSPDGMRLVSTGGLDSAQVWDARSGEPLLTLPVEHRPGRTSLFSPNGRRLASAADDGTVRVWDARSGEPLLTLQDAGVPRAFSPDGLRLVSTGNGGCVRVWDALSSEPLLTLQDIGVPRAFSPDGLRLVSTSEDGSIRVWDARSGQPLLNVEAHHGPASDSAFSPDGTQLVSTGFDGTLRVWDAKSGAPLLMMHAHIEPVSPIAFSPDGTQIVSAGSNNTVRVWDTRSGDPLLNLEGHSGSVSAIAFSRVGTQLVSSGHDGIRVWDARSGEPLLNVQGHSGPVSAVAFSPDGTQLVSAGSDGTVRAWDAHTGEPVGFILHHLPNGELALITPDASEIRWATAGAWRWLGWQAPDRETGAMMIYPAETFGPLPPPPPAVAAKEKQ